MDLEVFAGALEPEGDYELLAFSDLDLTRARLAGADLRGADLRELDGLGGLAGTTISSDQLLELAGPLAAHLGITVV